MAIQFLDVRISQDGGGVLALAGEIRYTMTLTSSAAATVEAAGLGGEAAAGNFTG